MQQIYDELNRRGVFKKNPEAQAIGHELRRRGVIKDATQGGLVTPQPQAQKSSLPPVKLFRTKEEAKRQVQQATIRLADDPQVNRPDLSYAQGQSVSVTGKSQLKSTKAQLVKPKPESAGQKAGKAVQKAGEVIAAPFKKADEMAARALLQGGLGTAEAQTRFKAAQEKSPSAKPYMEGKSFWELLTPQEMEALAQDPTIAGGIARFGANLLTPANALPLGAVARGGTLASRAVAGAFGVPAAVSGAGQVAGAENPGQVVEGMLNTLLGVAGVKQAATKPQLPLQKTTRKPVPTVTEAMRRGLPESRVPVSPEQLKQAEAAAMSQANAQAIAQRRAAKPVIKAGEYQAEMPVNRATLPVETPKPVEAAEVPPVQKQPHEMTREEFAVPGLQRRHFVRGQDTIPHYDIKKNTIVGAETGDFTASHELGHALTEGENRPDGLTWRGVIESSPEAKKELAQYKKAELEFLSKEDRFTDDRTDAANYKWNELAAHIVGDYATGALEAYPALRSAVEKAAHPQGRIGRFIRHKTLVQAALAEGKPVPPEVLADYPDLQAKYGQPAPAEPLSTPPTPDAPTGEGIAPPAPQKPSFSDDAGVRAFASELRAKNWPQNSIVWEARLGSNIPDQRSGTPENFILDAVERGTVGVEAATDALRALGEVNPEYNYQGFIDILPELRRRAEVSGRAAKFGTEMDTSKTVMRESISTQNPRITEGESIEQPQRTVRPAATDITLPNGTPKERSGGTDTAGGIRENTGDVSASPVGVSKPAKPVDKSELVKISPPAPEPVAAPAEPAKPLTGATLAQDKLTKEGVRSTDVGFDIGDTVTFPFNGRLERGEVRGHTPPSARNPQGELKIRGEDGKDYYLPYKGEGSPLFNWDVQNVRTEESKGILGVGDFSPQEQYRRRQSAEILQKEGENAPQQQIPANDNALLRQGESVSKPDSNAPLVEKPATAPNQANLTGAPNRVTEAERAKRGQSEVERQAYTTIPQALEQGKAAIQSGTIDPRAVAKFVATTPRVLSPEEVGALAYDRVTLINEYDSLTAQIAEAVDKGDLAKVPDLETARQLRLDWLDDNDNALVKGGREQSAAFNARKLIIGMDYRPAVVLQRAKAAAGRVLDKAERDKFEGLTKRLSELEGKLKEAQDALTATQEKQTAVRQNKSAQQVPEGGSIKERLLKTLSAEEQQKLSQAVARLHEKTGGVRSSLPGAEFLTALPELTEIGVIYAKAIGRSFKEWAQAMEEEFKLSRAQSEMVYANVKDAARKEKGTPQQFTEPESFADRLAQKLGREGSVEFLNKIDDGNQTILTKLINGDALTNAEKKTIQDAWAANSVTRRTRQESGAAKAVSDIIKETAKERARQRLAQARANMTPEKREAIAVNRLQGQIQDLTSRIQQGNFSLPSRPKPPEPSAQVKALQAQRDLLKAKIQSEIAKMRPKTFGQRVAEVASVPRSLITSIDLSAPLRQGSFLALSNPRMGLKSVGPMLRALRSEANAKVVENEIKARPNYEKYEASGLYLAPLDETSRLSKREESYMSTLAEKFPGVRPSERAYVTYLNKLRADSFDMFHRQLPNATPEQLAALADFINTATGRGKLGTTGERASALLSNIFFSPRYLTSRMQLLAGEPLYRGDAATRKLIARTYLQYAGAVTGIVLLAKQGGAEVETDPRHTDFLKLKSGNTVVDVLSGLQQAGTFLARMATGEKVSAAGNTSDLTNPKFGGDTRFDLGVDFLRGKLAPVPGSAVNLLAGKDIGGKPATPATEAVRLSVPMSWPDVYQAAKEEGIPHGSAVFLMSLFGLGTQYRSPQEKAAKKKRGGSASDPFQSLREGMNEIKRLQKSIERGTGRTTGELLRRATFGG